MKLIDFTSYKLKRTSFKTIGFNWFVVGDTIPSGFLWNNKICDLVQQCSMAMCKFMFNCQIRGVSHCLEQCRRRQIFILLNLIKKKCNLLNAVALQRSDVHHATLTTYPTFFFFRKNEAAQLCWSKLFRKKKS